MGNKNFFSASASLFKRGVRGVDLFVVLDGQLELYEENSGGRYAIVSTLTKAQFTGDLIFSANVRSYVDRMY